MAVVGRDDGGEDYEMVYFDQRGVSRVYGLGFADGVLRLWRDHPGFSQRFTGTLSDDGDTMVGRWETSEDGERWEVDFDITYRRVG